MRVPSKPIRLNRASDRLRPPCLCGRPREGIEVLEPRLLCRIPHIRVAHTTHLLHAPTESASVGAAGQIALVTGGFQSNTTGAQDLYDSASRAWSTTITNPLQYNLGPSAVIGSKIYFAQS